MSEEEKDEGSLLSVIMWVPLFAGALFTRALVIKYAWVWLVMQIFAASHLPTLTLPGAFALAFALSAFKGKRDKSEPAAEWPSCTELLTHIIYNMLTVGIMWVVKVLLPF